MSNDSVNIMQAQTAGLKTRGTNGPRLKVGFLKGYLGGRRGSMENLDNVELTEAQLAATVVAAARNAQ
ncbi:hypothetical protein HAX54_005734 [Datura stramonium]|uniref:Uncharacterized protein n=1 Tax=Datura stramonium TaxID=4076 RepID=A0ABS8RUB3_DATST|nr:hypothetical protein [Datura stramonium]